MACTFCKKPGPIWYILASGASFLIYTPPIGGHHPVLYFPSQIQRNIVQRCASGGDDGDDEDGANDDDDDANAHDGDGDWLYLFPI